jgi:hypothetical protein
VCEVAEVAVGEAVVHDLIRWREFPAMRLDSGQLLVECLMRHRGGNGLVMSPPTGRGIGPSSWLLDYRRDGQGCVD